MIGIVAVYLTRAVDETVTRVADIMFSFPPVLLGLLVTAIAGPGMLSAVAVIVLFTLPTMLRVVRAAVITIRHRDFVVIAEVVGASFRRRVFVHLLPNVMTPALVIATLELARIIILDAALSFLGLGVQDPIPSWGKMISQGAQYMQQSPLIGLVPIVCIALTMLSFSFVGDGLRDALDPNALE